MSEQIKADTRLSEHVNGPENVTTTSVDEEKGRLQVDTVHGDEATKVLATYEGDQEWSPEEEKKLTKRIDWKLLPVLCITYGLLYYDKAMLGQAVSGVCFSTLVVVY